MTVKLRGVLTTLITPFRSNGEVDEEGLKRLVQFQIQGRVHGIIPTVGCGEFYLLSHEERKKVLNIVTNETQGKVPIIAGTSAPSTKETIKLTKYAKDIGADAVMIILSPFYYKPTDAGIYEHYRSVAEAVDIPIVIYNDPGANGFDISPQLLARLSKEYENIRYLKESNRDISKIPEIIRVSEGRITVFCGEDDLSLPEWMLGAKGWTPSTSNYAPQLCVELFESFEKGDIKHASELWKKLITLTIYSNNKGFIPTTKEVMKMLGLPAGLVRKPLVPLSEEDKKGLKEILINLGLLKTGSVHLSVGVKGL